MSETQINNTVKPCVCGKKMIKRYSRIVLMSQPPQYPYDWWCACGKTEEGGRERGKTAEEMDMEVWEKANG